MNIALIGYGNMGQEIERIVENDEKYTIVSVISHSEGWDEKGLQQADVVIDFSSPDAVLENIQRVLGLGKHMVVGTSGWYDNLSEVEEIVTQTDTGLVYGQNFAIGTNVFFQIVQLAAKLTSQYGSYDVYGHEIHHTGKKDSPSGTALKIAEVIMDTAPTKKRLQIERSDTKIADDQLHFASIRGGRNPGMHEVVFDSEADSITLSVQNHSRRGYAEGALMAATFIQDKKGFFAFDSLFTNLPNK